MYSSTPRRVEQVATERGGPFENKKRIDQELCKFRFSVGDKCPGCFLKAKKIWGL